MDDRELALYMFRMIVYTLYLEIGGLKPSIHPALAEKADLENVFFHGEKERHAANLYRQTEKETDPERILEPYVLRTHLTLEDVHRAFAEGDWRNKFGGYNLGGPKWARISEVALGLRRAIEEQDWDAAANLVYEVKKLKTNQGYLINLFERVDRGR
jgi:hypothetical protein